ncbi:hypothetical protein LCGC14_1967050 [marine sediment metagenome]|uniref:NIPSNAP domain-containing protein n=1 Tax=marine sediment metagenome TaxID=412755 RepID=A0A0F9G142_9ZZZZ
MVVYMLTVWYPFNKAQEVTNIVSKYTTFPDFITKWRVFGTAAGKKGVKSYNLIYVQDDKTAEATAYIVRLQQEFTDAVDGYTYKVEILLSMSDMQKAQAVKL